ncbi:MAG: hypothetical protein L0Z07_08425, partial [Planctomycetes bacterium]|nr:hypothetical protein [Planctomycetota bacterium]
EQRGWRMLNKTGRCDGTCDTCECPATGEPKMSDAIKNQIHGHTATKDHQSVIEHIFTELRRAEAKHPSWPTDPIHAVGILVEEAGESMQAAIDYVYAGGSLEDIKTELAQTGAMAIRALIHLDMENP